MGNSGYDTINSSETTAVPVLVKLFNAMYGTEHATYADASQDVKNLANDRISTSQSGIISVLFNIAQIVMGAVYVNDCKLQCMVPLSLIVAGCLALMREVLTMLRWRAFVSNLRGEKLGAVYQASLSNGALLVLWITWLITIAWLILSGVWVYSTISDLSKSAIKETAGQNIQKHGAIHLPDGIYVDTYTIDEHGQHRHVKVIDETRTCNNSILLFAFFMVSLRLTSLVLNIIIAFWIALCGVLAIYGAEAEGLVATGEKVTTPLADDSTDTVDAPTG